MEHSTGNIEKAHKTEGQRRIGELKRKIGTTKDNIEVSEEIIANSASDAQREKLIEKNTQRRHAVGSMKKEIRDIEQTIEERGKEVSTGANLMTAATTRKRSRTPSTPLSAI